MSVNEKPRVHKFLMSGAIFVKKGDKYLVNRRSPFKKFAAGVVHPIGGMLNTNEDPLLGAQRELLEEIGVKVKNIRLEAVVMEINSHKNSPYNWLCFYFTADFESGKPIKSEEGDPLWLTSKEILKQNLFPSVKQIIKNILNPKDGVIFATFEYNNKGNIVNRTKKINSCVVY